MSPLRVAGLGAGYFSQFHYGSWARLDRIELVVCCDRDIAKARATGLPAHDDLAMMLTETRPDLLDIILPPAAHADTIRTALAAGIGLAKGFQLDDGELLTIVHRSRICCRRA